MRVEYVPKGDPLGTEREVVCAGARVPCSGSLRSLTHRVLLWSVHGMGDDDGWCDWPALPGCCSFVGRIRLALVSKPRGGRWV